MFFNAWITLNGSLEQCEIPEATEDGRNTPGRIAFASGGQEIFLKRLGLTYEEERIRVEVELNGEAQGDPDFILS